MRLLIANRGEIARRVLRTARRRGMQVAVISTAADRRSPVRREADQVFEVPSFLDIEAIVRVARGARVDLLHPGYGYLSESPAFAEAVTRAGIAFVGPSADAMRALGDKEAARTLAVRKGVPVLPALGSDDLARLPPPQWGEALARLGISAPYLVKAAAGGGGRGMRVAESEGDLGAALDRASAEAAAAFGDGRVFVERFIASPRHVEVQVFGDGRGGGVVFGERECSLQRRHQKLVEESPSSVVGPELRRALGASALSLVRVAKYGGAGTVEFLLEDGGRFYLLEVNVRLQVEHPVTEMTYGVDLVDAQLDLALGRWPAAFPGPETLTAPEPHGHAVEARVLAEDPRRDFLPAPGHIVRYREPEGPGVRVDSGVALGSEVTTEFDSLLLKVVCHGSGRSEALARLAAALRGTVIHGCGTNLAFLHELAQHQDVRAGRISTTWIGEHLDELNAMPVGEGLPGLLGGALAATRLAMNLDGATSGALHPLAERFARQPQGQPSLAAALRPDLRVARTDRPGELILGGTAIGAGAGPLRVTATRLAPREMVLSAGAETIRLTDARESSLAQGVDGTSLRVLAPMAGTVVEVRASAGQKVGEGDVLFVLESMKMQMAVLCPAAGVVSAVFVRAADVLSGPEPLASIETSNE